MPSCISMTTFNASGDSTAPATPMASTPSDSSDPAPAAPTTAPRHQPSSSSHACKIDDLTKKWVINLSKTPLTPGHLSLLQKGPNFAITPKYPLMEVYITVVEGASSKVPSMESDELRLDTSSLLRHTTCSTTNTAISTHYNAEHSHSLNRTHPGWY